ncbi:hypothetical protein [Amycolatopsis sp. NPDC049159]|uniref:hypothetical protein n=1 Tax=Amycolatopsis sp. NPDC049159 TaxID=3157210 RepID=UPI0034106985
MNDVVRMPRWLLAAHLIVVGLGYVFGPATGGGFVFIRELGLPIPLWGAVFTAAGLLLLFRRRTIGHAVAAFACTFWGIGLVVPILIGEATSGGGWAHTLILAAPAHVIALWQRSKSRLDAGSSTSR